MEFLSSLAPDWVSTTASPDAEQADRVAADAARERLNQLLTDFLLAENLVVLAGLGTSLCLNDGGSSLAPDMGTLWSEIRDRAGNRFSRILRQVKYTTPESGQDDIELLLSRCQLRNSLSASSQITAFIKLAEETIAKRCRFVGADTDLATHEAFLRKVARRSTRQPRLKLFTTNYDLCFETAATRSRFVVIDGFSHTPPQEFDGGYFSYDFVRRDSAREAPDYIQNVFQLFKMHGSVDWEIADSRILRVATPSRPHLIYPRHTKFEASYDQPFIEMISRFQIALREPNTALLVVGVGFNDHHIVQPILSAIRSNIGLRAVVVSPGLRTASQEAPRAITQLIQGGDARLILLVSTFQELVRTLPSLVSETEEEQHRRRVLSATRSR